MTKPLLMMPAASFGRILAGLDLAMSKDADRWVLQHLHVEVGDGLIRLVATNGNWLACVTIEQSPFEDLVPATFDLAPEAMRAARAACESFSGVTVGVSLHNDKLVLNFAGARLAVDVSSQTYPEWRKVIGDKPPTSPQETLVLWSHLLRRIGELGETICDGDGGCGFTTTRLDGDFAPMRFESGIVLERCIVTAVVMPMRRLESAATSPRVAKLSPKAVAS